MILRSTFTAMGNTAVVELDAASASLFPFAHRRIEELEQAWSRFLPTSDISRVNSASGAPVMVGHDTVTLLKMMQYACTLTSGLFDPTLLDCVLEAGYTHSLTSPLRAPLDEEKASPHRDRVETRLTGLETLGQLVIEDTLVTLPPGSSIDPGAIGKGLAADLVLGDLIGLGAKDVCVSIGGDLAFAGSPRRIAVLSPHDSSALATIAFERGGVATSSTKAKRFLTNNTPSHHVIDPTTHRPLANGVTQATVLASSCAWAEALATASLVAGHTVLVDSLGIGALLVADSGAALPSSHWNSL